MSVTAPKAEVICEKSEYPFLMSVMRGQSRSVFRLSKTAAVDPGRHHSDYETTTMRIK
ncbi:MAG: hypothetical protein V7701_04890 [Sneathiella sp.]